MEMSGNSACRRRQTVPIVRSRSRAGAEVVAIVSGGGRSGGTSDLHLVAVAELGAVDALPVHEGAVQAAAVLDHPPAVLVRQHGVLAGDGDVVEEDATVRRPADRRPVALRREGLAGAAAAGADDERRPGVAAALELLEHLVAVLGAERLRLLPRLGRVQERTALRAVVRGLRVLEAAGGAVDVAHRAAVTRPTARPCPRGSRSATRRPPGRARSGPPSSGGARRAPRGGCRSSRGGCGGGTRPPAPPSCTRRSGASGPRR